MNNTFSKLGVWNVLSYLVILFSALQMLLQVPSLFPFPYGSNQMNQLWNNIIQFNFSLIGIYVLYKLKKMFSDRLDDEDEATIIQKIKNLEHKDKIVEAFPRLKQLNINTHEAVAEKYYLALMSALEILKQIKYFWAAWAAYYLTNIFKNLYYFDNFSIKPTLNSYYYIETLETFCNNIVCAFAFSLYFKLDTMRKDNKNTLKNIKYFLIFIFLTHLTLISLTKINPLQVNWSFQIIGSTLSGIALVLLFSRLCGKSINPHPVFSFVFFTYAVLQPIILLSYTEAMILRMPQSVRTSTATQMIDNGIYAVKNSPYTSQITQDTKWLTSNRNSLIKFIDQVDFDSESIKRCLELSPLSDSTQLAIVTNFTNMRIQLTFQEGVKRYAIIRRWFLLAGKAFFLIFVIWLYWDGKILKYFMNNHSSVLVNEEENFLKNRKHLPYLFQGKIDDKNN